MRFLALRWSIQRLTPRAPQFLQALDRRGKIKRTARAARNRFCRLAQNISVLGRDEVRRALETRKILGCGVRRELDLDGHCHRSQR